MDGRIKLQVGERHFITSKDTLIGESAYFQALLSGRWKDPGDDGYFIDSDPELFTEILRYLRSGNFPLFFDPTSQTYDYAKYVALLGEAQYFGITKLENWIQKQSYLDAVKISYGIRVHECGNPENVECLSQDVRANERVNFSHISRTTRVYLCPRRISVHRGHPENCGRQCENARGKSEREYEDVQLLTTVSVKTELRLKPEVCLGVHAEKEENV
ncbi:hypothetical protein F4678DRAFT_429247 [Xylaria arbuscula]|nr:hypothetical protein F4678DRAFT_429247 [Xylaria arbuscula]